MSLFFRGKDWEKEDETFEDDKYKYIIHRDRNLVLKWYIKYDEINKIAYIVDKSKLIDYTSSINSAIIPNLERGSWIYTTKKRRFQY